MAAVLARFFQTISLSAIMVVGVIVVSPTAAHADMLYGSGIYGGDIYNGSESTAGSAGGPCLNCDTTTPTSHSGGSSGGGSSHSVAATTTTTSTTTPSAASSSSSTAFYCPDTGNSSDGLSTAGLVNLFVSLGIIPKDKAQKACDALVSGQTGVAASPVAKFTTPLKLGSRGSNVRMLQVFLNTHGFVIATTGSGSVGNETDYYGTLTVAAVKRFQQAYKAEILTPVGLTIPSGFFGPSSMKKANALIGR